MIKIFLCYAREDLIQANRLFQTLNSVPNISVWFDKESLLPGQKWEIEIRKAVASSHFILLLLSSNSISKQGFYQREIRFALHAFDEYPEEKIFLLPIRLDECTPHFEQLRSIQYVDLFPDWDNGIAKILTVLTVSQDKTVEQYQQLLEHTVSTPNAKQIGAIVPLSILFLSADPSDATRLRLDQEFREIHEKLKLAKLREQFRLELPQLSARPEDVSQALLEIRPKIVHFSGHGTPTGALYLESRIGKAHLVEADALANLFEQFKHEIDCVILNVCYSEIQANAISKHINYVIGMNYAVDDGAAIAFSIGFYQALGAGCSIEVAYKLGCIQIGLHGISCDLLPILINRGQVCQM